MKPHVLTPHEVLQTMQCPWCLRQPRRLWLWVLASVSVGLVGGVLLVTYLGGPQVVRCLYLP